MEKIKDKLREIYDWNGERITLPTELRLIRQDEKMYLLVESNAFHEFNDKVRRLYDLIWDYSVENKQK